jgi:hypothetical protein
VGCSSVVISPACTPVWGPLVLHQGPRKPMGKAREAENWRMCWSWTATWCVNTELQQLLGGFPRDAQWWAGQR